MQITKTESKFLNELVKDCITYGLEEKEAMQYFEVRFKTVSLSSYKHRKARVLSEGATQVWLNHFTRIGFVTAHKQHIEAVEKLQQDSLRQFYIETTKEQQERDEDKIVKLKQDIRDNVKLLSELNLGTPIISAIKAKLEQNDVKTIQVRE
jgi:ribosomal protein L15